MLRLLLLPLLLLALPAFAEDVVLDVEEAEEAAEGEGAKNGISGRVLLGGVSVPDEGSFPLAGLGIAYERDLWDVLALELALEGVATPIAQAYLVELVLEKPVDINDWAGVYFGGGPTLALHVINNKPQPGAGYLAMIGVEFVLVGELELFIELDAAMLYFDRVILETDVGTGILYRF